MDKQNKTKNIQCPNKYYHGAGGAGCRSSLSICHTVIVFVWPLICFLFCYVCPFISIYVFMSEEKCYTWLENGFLGGTKPVAYKSDIELIDSKGNLTS